MDKNYTCSNHEFEDIGAGLVHPHWFRDHFMPVDYCIHCGTLRVKLEPVSPHPSDRKIKIKKA